MSCLRFPDIGRAQPALGVGFDLRWGDGLLADPDRGDRAAPGPRAFLDAHSDRFAHLFVSWQPKSRGRLCLDDYVAAWDDFFEGLEGYGVRALHQTALNLASASYDRREVFALTNALVARYGLAWVNEDLGLWSLCGRPLPYPLPPLLTDAGLAACEHNIRESNHALEVPLVVEFPGFSQGYSLCAGPWDAYDFFREVVERTSAPCTLDLGHLLSWRWLKGHRGEALLHDLDRLPLEHCFEIHLSGIAVEGERFVDAHHGVLVDAQFALSDALRARCPNLRAVTFEDPRFDADGVLDPSNVDSLQRLVAACAVPVPLREATARPAREIHTSARTCPAFEVGLDRVLRSSAAHARLRSGDDLGLPPEAAADIRSLTIAEVDALGREVRRQVADRRCLGQRRLRDRFALVFGAWDGDPDGLLSAFGDHEAGRGWGELGERRTSLEEAFYRFASSLDLVDAVALRHAYHLALITALAIDPDPAFTVPAHVRGGPGRWLVLEDGRIWAAVGARIVIGPLPDLAAAVLRGDAEVPAIRARLVALGLL